MTQIVSSLRVSNSAYGQCIPYVFGRPRIPQKLIYWANLQTATAGQKKGKKGGQTVYSVNADMLLGYGPLAGIAGIWQNQTWWYVNYSSQTFTGVGTISSLPFTISNNASTVVLILGVQLAVNYSVAYNDYGGFGITRSSTPSGTSQMPLYNNQFPAPNYGTWANAGIPYADYNATYGSGSGTAYFPTPLTNPVITVFYCEVGGSDQPPAVSGGKKGGGGVPIQQPGLTFERVLGTGPSGNPQTFHEYSGVSGANIPLGPSPEIAFFNFETLSLFAFGNSSPASSFNPGTGGYTAATASGDCNPADIILDIVTSGNRADVLAGTQTYIWQHGLGFSSAVSSTNPGYCYSRYGGILADESTLWSGGSNVGLNAVRNYCMAYGIFISGVLDSQTSGADFLSQLCRLANAAPVWTGAALDFIPYCEVSAYGNGYSYVAPTAAGPLFTLGSNHILPQTDKSSIEWTRDRPGSNFNSMQIGFRDATQQFNQNYVIIADTMDIAVQGPLPGSQETFDYITNAATAQSVGWSLLRRNLTVNRQEFKFSLPAYWETIFTPMDLISLYDPSINPFPIPVRFKTIEIAVNKESGKRMMEVTAEPFIYGASMPLPPTTTGTPPVSGGGGGGAGVPGSVNTPIFIETIPALNTAGPQLWICVSGTAAAYGGCAVWMSTDGGASYGAGPIGVIVGRQTMGLVYNSNYPSHADPDNTNSLYVDLTESLETLLAVTSATQNAFQSLLYLEGGGTVVVNGQTLTIPYELAAYQGATLAALNKYQLTPPIRRGVYNTPIAAHNIGKQISYLHDGLVFAMNMTQALIGVTLHFKFTAFNITMGNQQQLSAVTAYPFTPTGLVGWTYNAGGGGGTGTPTGNANDLYCYVPGVYANSQELSRITPSRQINFPAGLTNSVATCDTAPTGSIQITINKNGSSIGTVNFAAGATTGTFTFASGVALNGTGDVLTLVAPTSADLTFAGASVTLWATRTN